MAEPSEATTEEKIDRSRLDGARGAVMVVVTLIATMNFGSALNPPGGVWPENSYTARAGSFNCTVNTTCMAGTAVLAYSDTKSYVSFVAANTFTLCFCLMVIIGLVLWYTFDISADFLAFGLFVSLLVVLVGFTYLKALEMLTPRFVWKDHDMRQIVRWYKTIMGAVSVSISIMMSIMGIAYAYTTMKKHCKGD